MRTMKKFASLLLALVMVFSFSFSVFADETTYTITITSDKSGHTYEAYQIFTGTLHEETINGVATTVLSDIEWGSGVDSDKLISALISASTTEGSALNGLFPTMSNGVTISYTAEMIAEIIATFGDDSDAAEEFAQIASECLTTTVAGTSTETTSPYTIIIPGMTGGRDDPLPR